jgi:DNA adenine methylase
MDAEAQERYDFLMGLLDPEEEVREEPIRAPFGWPGGKDLSKHAILERLPYRDGYVEHCGGSGVIALNRRPSKLNVFNDRDSGVTCFYRCIVDPVKVRRLIDRLSMAIYSREEFFHCKKTWRDCIDDVERAARWYYVVRCSFNQQRRNWGRAVAAANRNPQIAAIANSLKLFPAIHHKMKEYQIDNLSVFQSLRDYNKEGIVHYIDPNYVSNDETGVWSHIYEHELTLHEHEQLVKFIHDQGRGFYALSGYPNRIYDNPHYEWTDRIEWKVPVKLQAQSFTATNHRLEVDRNLERDIAIECLWIKDHG